MKRWKVYLAGEIHTNWRDEVLALASEKNLLVQFYSPQLDHGLSDSCGDRILGEEPQPFWKDHKAAKINTIRNHTLLERSDIVVVKFGEKYRQWNAAFDAGYAHAMGKKLIVMHDESLTHALKEIDAVALAVTQTPAQVVDILEYVI